MLLWLIVATGTVKNVFYGNLFEAPCLRELEKKAAVASLGKPHHNA
jgi:hypothetical protein